MISPTERLRELGGVATRGTLTRATGRAALDRAVAAGDVVRVAWGRYAPSPISTGTPAPPPDWAGSSV